MAIRPDVDVVYPWHVSRVERQRELLDQLVARCGMRGESDKNVARALCIGATTVRRMRRVPVTDDTLRRAQRCGELYEQLSEACRHADSLVLENTALRRKLHAVQDAMRA